MKYFSVQLPRSWTTTYSISIITKRRSLNDINNVPKFSKSIKHQVTHVWGSQEDATWCCYLQTQAAQNEQPLIQRKIKTQPSVELLKLSLVFTNVAAT